MNNKRDKETRKSTNLTVLSCVVVMVIMLVKNLFSTKKMQTNQNHGFA